MKKDFESLENEIWKPVKNFSGYYASNKGRIKRVILNKETLEPFEERLIEGHLSKNKTGHYYKRLSMVRDDGKRFECRC